jgi:hypothetical protein
VGRYSDTFEPRAFGDNLQKWGTSTILIESGGYPDDREKQEIRKLNYVSILAAIFAIADGSYAQAARAAYYQIPRNDRKLFDLKLENLNYPLRGRNYQLDVGFHYQEIDLPGHSDFYFRGQVVDQGDLSTYYGYETLDASRYTLQQGKVYPQVLPDLASLEQLNIRLLLQQGYTHFRVVDRPDGATKLPWPVVVAGPEFELKPLQDGVLPSSFLLVNEGQIDYAIINGFLLDLNQPLEQKGNGWIVE